MNVEEMLEALNDSDASGEMEELRDAMRTIETVENERDFSSNLNDAIQAAESLARTLSALRRETIGEQTR